MIPMNGKRVSSRELRRKLNLETEFLASEVTPAIKALLHNDQVSQKRITDLETRSAEAETILTTHRAMTFWQRLSWVLRGVR